MGHWHYFLRQGQKTLIFFGRDGGGGNFFSTQGLQHFLSGSRSNRFQPVPARPSAGNAIQAFGNGTDVGVWQPQPPLKPTVPDPGISRRVKDRTGNSLDTLPDFTKLDLDDNSLYHNCGTLQVSPLTAGVREWGGAARIRAPIRAHWMALCHLLPLVAFLLQFLAK